MATITLRSVKGSPLTNTEVDNNFTNLNNDKLESSSYTAADVLAKIKTVDGSGSGLDADLLDGKNSTDANTSSTIVARDASGDFSAGTITADLTGNVTGDVTGNADTATALETARTINGVSFDGTANITTLTAGTGISVSGTSVAIDTTETVDLATAQTLSNKTLTEPVINTATADDLILTGTLTAGGTTGTSGYLLQSTGTGIQWASATISLAGGSGSGSVSTGGTLTINGTTNRITTSVSSGTITINAPQDLHTSSNFRVNSLGIGTAATGTAGRIDSASIVVSGNGQTNSLGVGTAASGTAGEIRATNQIVAYYSDKRLKENIKPIESALDKVNSLRGVTYTANTLAESFGYTDKSEQVGVIAQEVEEVLPQIVKPAPFDISYLGEGVEVSKSGQHYKTVQYEKLVPLLIEAIKELNNKVEELTNSKE